MAKYMDSENFKHFWNNILKPNLLKKVDKVSGKGLSTNDFTDTYKNAIGSLQDSVGALNTTKVDKVIGKDLSTNDFTNEYKDLIVANKDAISKLKGFIYPCTAQALEEMSQEQQAELHTQGYRAIKTENNGTVVLLGLASDGSLEWLGCNQPRGSLLDNGDFAIAQAGYGGMHGNAVYAADRWPIYNATFSSGEKGSITVVGGGSEGNIYQRFFPTSGPVTIGYFDASENLYLINANIPDVLGAGTISIASNQYIGVFVNEKTIQVNFVVNAGETVIFSKAFCYSGSYTPKTLPPWEPPDSVSKMTKCRQFYRSLSAYGFVGIAIVDADNSVQGVILGEQMRIFNPSILGAFVVYTPTSSTNITAFNSVSYQGNGFRFSAQTTGGIAIGTIGFLCPVPDSGAISADI